jgi:hypothetical protein
VSDTIDRALEYFQKRKQTLEDEILRRQIALEEVDAFIATAQDGRSKIRRDAKRGNSDAMREAQNQPLPSMAGMNQDSGQ